MILNHGATGGAVRSVQEMLGFLGFREKRRTRGVRLFVPMREDGAFRDRTESVVIDFQRSEGLLQDGIVGPITMRALEAAYTRRLLELNSPGPDTAAGMPDRLGFERVTADTPNGEGYPRICLRNDVAADFRAVRDELRRRGGQMVVSAGVRHLETTLNANRSATSFHYLGRAVDLHLFSGMVDPRRTPYVVCRTGSREHRVYARCSEEWNEDADLPEESRLEKVVTYNDPQGKSTAEGCFLDLTALFEEHGFRGIRARRRFEEKSSLMGADWWHFQHERGLVEHVSTFGQELLKVYSEDTLEGTGPWRHRRSVFGVNWAWDKDREKRHGR